MASTPGQRQRVTYADYLALPEDGRRWQVLEGELEMTPAPLMAHQAALRELSLALGTWVEHERVGVIFFAPTDVVLDDHNVVQPDLLFVSAVRTSIITAANVSGAPDLVVEILSPSTAALDRGRKRQIYARHGVAWLWLIDPQARTVEEYRLEDGAYRLATSLAPADTVFRPQLFPGFECPLGRLFAPPTA